MKCFKNAQKNTGGEQEENWWKTLSLPFLETSCGKTPIRLHALGLLTGEVRVGPCGQEMCPPQGQ